MAQARAERRPKSEAASITTVKISRSVASHISKKAVAGESIDGTLRRLLGLPSGAKDRVIPMTTTVKITRVVMNHITEKSGRGESRDDTLRRLLGLDPQDGNVEVAP